MRIMMLAQFYPPIIGGEERHVQNLSRGLVARGHDVVVVTQWHAGMPAYSEEEGVRIYRVRALAHQLPWLFSESDRRHAPPWADPITSRAIADIIAKEQPEIVHAHNWMLYAFLPLKKRTEAKLVLTLHDYSQVCVKKNLLLADGAACSGPELAKCLRCATEHYGPVKGRPVVVAHWRSRATALRNVDMFLPVSQAVADGNQLTQSGRKFQVVPNFIPDDLADHRATDDPLLAQLPPQDFLLYVGDLSRQKGIEVLLSAYARLSDAPPLVLIGRPFPDTPTTLPEGVRVLHSWPHAAVLEAWHRCLFGVVPSIWADPCPTVALEAMSMGKAVIASHIGGLPDQVVDGVTGALVAAGDVDALTDALQRFLANQTSYQAMGNAAVHWVERFQASTVIPAIEQIYASLLGNGLHN